MSDAESTTDDSSGVAAPTSAQPEVVSPDAVQPGRPEGEQPGPPEGESVTQPAKVMRIGSMVKQLLDEVRNSSLDEASRERLAEVYERSVTELSEALSPDLQEELRLLAIPFDHDDVPSEAELRVAKAQLVGWLEGLFHGIQATLMAQQAAAHQQLQHMRQLPDGQVVPVGQQRDPHGPGAQTPDRPGTYL